MEIFRAEKGKMIMIKILFLVWQEANTSLEMMLLDNENANRKVSLQRIKYFIRK